MPYCCVVMLYLNISGGVMTCLNGGMGTGWGWKFCTKIFAVVAAAVMVVGMAVAVTTSHMPHRTAPHCTTTTPHHTMSYCTTHHHILLCQITPHYTTPFCTTPCTYQLNCPTQSCAPTVPPFPMTTAAVHARHQHLQRNALPFYTVQQAMVAHQ